MKPKYLKYQKVLVSEFVRTKDLQFQIHYIDDEGNSYFAVPKWEDLLEAVTKASNVENFNRTKTQHEWVTKIREAVQSIVESEKEQITDAKTIYGMFDSIEDGKFVIEEPLEHEGFEVYKYHSLIAVDRDWLVDNLNKWFTFLIINNYIVEMIPR